MPFPDRNHWQTFISVRFPFAMPFVFAGLKVGMAMAMIGIIVGEFITGQEGLGYVIMFAFSAGELSRPALCGFDVLATMGLGLYSCVLFAELAVQRWYGAPFSVRRLCLMPLWGTLANCARLR